MFIAAYVGARPAGRPLPPLADAPSCPTVPLHLIHSFARDMAHDGRFAFYGELRREALLDGACLASNVHRPPVWSSAPCHPPPNRPQPTAAHLRPLLSPADPEQLDRACSQQCGSQRGMLSLAGAGFAWGPSVDLNTWVHNAVRSLQGMLQRYNLCGLDINYEVSACWQQA